MNNGKKLNIIGGNMQDVMKHVSQIIPTIQGEMSHVGAPSLLIRFRQCNIKCPFCDTQWSNKHNNESYSFHDIKRYLDKYQISNILITGGETFLYIEQINTILRKIVEHTKQIKTVQLETNGTLHTAKNIENLFYGTINLPFKLTLNISPKLGEECYPDSFSLKGLKIVDLYRDNIRLVKDRSIDFVYKFIYSRELESLINGFLYDIIELNKIKISQDQIYMMPLTPDMREYNFDMIEDKMRFITDFQRSCQQTVDYCLNNGYQFSPREHVWIYGDKKNEHLDI